MSWGELLAFLRGFLPVRVWTVTVGGKVIGRGQKIEALEDWESLIESGEKASLQSAWMTRRKFMGWEG